MAAALAASLLLALGQVPWEAGLKVQERVLQGGAGDLVFDPTLAAGLQAKTAQLHAVYDPEILLREPSDRGTFNDLQRADLTGSIDFSPRTHMAADERLSIGATDLSWLALAPDAPPPFVVQGVTSTTVDTVDEVSSLTLDHALSPRTRVSGTARFEIAGGLGSDELAYPRIDTASVSATGYYVAARRDTLSITVTGSRGWLPATSGTTLDFATSATWQHTFLGHVEGSLGGGIAILGGDAQEQHGVVPTAAATLQHEVGTNPGSLGVRLGLHYTPVLDAATGSLAAQFQGSASLDLRLASKWVGNASGGTALTPSPPPFTPSQLSQGALGLTYEANRWLAFLLAARAASLPQFQWAGVLVTTISLRGRL